MSVPVHKACGTEVPHFIVNKKRGNQRTGVCPTCRKMVSLGKADDAEESGNAGPAPEEKASGKKPASGKAPAGTGGRAARKPAAGKKRAPGQREGNIQQPAAKRAGFPAALRRFFDL